MSIKKQYLQSKPECKVTFRLEKENAHSAKEVFIAGDFNQWNTSELGMKQLKSGDFTITLKLEKEKEYQFKYLLDKVRWINDSSADGYLPNSFQTENSLVIV